MFILAFILVLLLCQFLINKAFGVSVENEESYKYSKKDSLTIILFLVLQIILQVFSKPMRSFVGFVILGYVILFTICMIILSIAKKSRIERQKEEIQQVYEILQILVDKKNKGLDFNNVPFTLGYKYGKVNQIHVTIDPLSYKEDIISILLKQLNSFLPTFTWNIEEHLEERYIVFLGMDKPPNMARWPGSWLRHYRYQPIGITGKGEIQWVANKVPKQNAYHSQYLDEHGKQIPTDTSLPDAPHCLICGATNGGKAIYIKQVVD